VEGQRISVVTGGCGFVGKHLCDALRARGDRVRTIDLDPHPPRDDVEHVSADICDTGAMRRACHGATTVFHNASVVHTRQNRVDFVWRVNLEGSRTVMRACRDAGVPKLVYVSSGSVVYEGKDIENGDESLPYASRSQAPYADSKIAAEKEILASNGAGGVTTVALRPHVVFGPGDRRFLPALLTHAKAGRLRFQVGRGRWLSDYTYVSNLVDALLLADDKLAPGAPIAGRPYFVTNGEPMPFWDFVRSVLARLGLPPIRAAIPHQLVYAVAALKEGFETLRGGSSAPEDGLSRFAVRYMCTHHYFNIERARRELGYAPSVDVAQGIERTCAHLEATGAV
jgi:sterol-4alpha-carboxylate 3-dehydrogenase (decarboxylating)